MGTFVGSIEYVTIGPCSATVNERTGATCGQRWAMSRDFYNRTKRTGETWYCPSGHPRIWTGQTTEAKLAAAEAQAVALGDQLQAAVEEAETTRVALLRERHRYANGVCPCCNRSFENIARHIRGQHPDYDITRIDTPKYRCGCGMSFDSFRGLRTHQGHMRRPDWSDPDVSRWRSHLTVVAP